MSRLCFPALLALLLSLMACSTTSPSGEVPGEAELRDARVLFRIKTDRKLVALTIDDGPDAGTTPRLLDVLREHEARATFFVIGERAMINRDLLARMRDEGHELANHTGSDRPSALRSKSALAANLKETHEIIAPYGAIRWFRPGWAVPTPRQIETAAAMGYRTALGDVFPYDVIVPSVSFQTGYIIKHVKPGSIIIVHDHGGRGRRTSRTLAEVLPKLQAQGYEVVTLSQLAARTGG